MKQHGDIFAFDASEFSMSAFETSAPPEFIERENYPHCCEYHKNFERRVKEYADKFPNCCPNHQRLLTLGNFRKADYSYVEEKVIKNTQYTEFHIQNAIKNGDWYEDITDYIEYTTRSYGQPLGGYGAPVGLHLYEEAVKNFITSHKEFGKQKINRLLLFCDRYNKAVPAAEKADFVFLYTTYKTWLKTFPFDIPFFNEIKPQFENTIPLLAEKPIVNRYTGLASAKLQTNEGLLKLLTDLTNMLLKLMDSPTLVKDQIIKDVDTHRLQLIKENHRINQMSLLDDYTKGELKYVKVLKKWLVNEKVFFKEISPIMKAGIGNPNTSLLSFTEIDYGTGLLQKIPFEIAFIFQHPSPRKDRYARLKGKNYDFFADWGICSHFMETLKEGEIYNEQLEQLSWETLPPYLEYFSTGFVKGYHEFDSKIKSSTAVFESDIQSVILKVFEVINTPFPGLCSYGNITKEGRQHKIIKQNIWEEAGMKTGENYKAWFFIINNPHYFIDLFCKHLPFQRCYKDALAFWKDQPGGQGMYERLQLVVKKIDDVQSNVVPTKEQTEEENKTIAGVALLLYFLWKHGHEAAVTRTNASSKAAAYGFTAQTSGKQLFDDFSKFSQESERLRINRESPRAYKEHLKRYAYVLTKLPKTSIAFTTALQEQEQLQSK